MGSSRVSDLANRSDPTRPPEASTLRRAPEDGSGVRAGSGPAARTPAAGPSQSRPLEVSEMTPYLWALMGMLVSATIFDAFNIAILSTVAPIIQQLHGLNNTQWGLVNLIIRVGAVVSFFIL